MALWTPAEILTALWIDSSDSTTLFNETSGGSLPADSGNVKRWEDKSGNSRHLTASANNPVRRTAIQNGLDVVRCDTGYLDSGSFTLAQPFAVYLFMDFLSDPVTSDGDAFGSTDPFVALRPNWSTSGGLRGFFAGGSANRSPAMSTGKKIWAWHCNGASSRERLNGVQVNLSTNVGSNSLGMTRIGRRIDASGNIYLRSDYYEMIVTSDITNGVAERIEGYGAHKWGLESLLPSGHTYKNSAPRIASMPVIGSGGLIY